VWDSIAPRESLGASPPSGRGAGGVGALGDGVGRTVEARDQHQHGGPAEGPREPERQRGLAGRQGASPASRGAQL